MLEKIHERYGDIDVVAHKSKNFMDDVERLVTTKVFRMSSPSGNDDHNRLDNGYIDIDTIGGMNASMKNEPKTVLYIGPWVTSA